MGSYDSQIKRIKSPLSIAARNEIDFDKRKRQNKKEKEKNREKF